MIILITGASHTGKTLLAQRMLEKFHFPYLSIDHLKMGLIRSGSTDLTAEDDDALTEYLWPIVREIIKTAVENKQNLIIEGCYIPFGWRMDFDERYLADIRFICLAMTGNYIESHFGEIIAHESEIEARLIEADCTIAGLKEDNERYMRGFCDAGEQVALIDSDYERVIKDLMKDIRFRKCKDEDIVRVGEFYDEVVHWLDQHVNYPRWLHKVYPAEAGVRAMTEAGCQYICCEGESIVAAFALSAEPQGNYQKGNWSRDLPDGSYMVLHALAIDPERQRQGIGGEIIRFCVDQAKAEGCKAIRVDIVPTNYPARRLFEKNGFAYVGDVDLELDIGDIPEFSLYELNF